MGVITKCCTRDLIINNSQISLYTNSDIDVKEELIKELPSNLDQNGIFQFIISFFFHIFTLYTSLLSLFFKYNKLCTMIHILLNALITK